MKSLLAAKVILAAAAILVRDSAIRIITGNAKHPVEKIIEGAVYDAARYLVGKLTRWLGEAPQP